MVLIWRKKNKWDIKIKIVVTIIFWILFFALGAFGNSTDESKNEKATSEIETVSKESAAESSVEESENQITDDVEISQFVKDYNAQNEFVMSDFSKGNTKSKLYGYANECYIEMFNTSNGFEVTINGGNNKEITNKMFEVLPDFIYTLDKTLTEEQISQTVSDLKNEKYLLDDYKLGDNLEIKYSPLIFKDDGTCLSSSWTKISSMDYGK